MTSHDAPRDGTAVDVLKHLALAHALDRLRAKPKPFRAIFTHGAPAPGGAWRAPLAAADAAPDAVRDALAPLTRARLGDGDAVQVFGVDRADAASAPSGWVTSAEDGYAALPGALPPAERRGVVVLDPPFEHVDEMFFLAQAAKEGLTRWPTGTFVFCRPLNDLWAAERFDVALAEWLLTERDVAPEKVLRADLWVRDPVDANPPVGAGVLVVNPPYGLEDAFLAVLPWLAETFGENDEAGWRVDGAFTDDSLTVDEF